LKRLRFRLGFFVIAALLAGLAVVAPFAPRSLVEELAEPPEGHVFTLPIAPGVSPGPDHSRLHVSVVDLDEARLQVTLRVSGHRHCFDPCAYTERIIFFSYGTAEAATAGMPPSARVDLSTSESLVADTITLPITGHPSRYPFDTYHLQLGVGLARVLPDGAMRPESRAEAAGRLIMTLQAKLPREHMSAPVILDPDSIRDDDHPFEVQALTVLGFRRPLHARLLTVMLVLLIAAAAAYAVLLRPLHDLVINSGALVLGVWGVRAILTPGTAYGTVVDFALSTVIVFLLGAITVRALQFCHAHSDLRLWRGQQASSPETDSTPDGPECDHAGCGNPILYRCATCRQAYCPRHIDTGPVPTCDTCSPPAGAPSAREEQPVSR
jgi:hypothetical protein